MSARKFDRYMVVVGAGTNPKFARLSDSEWRCHVGGVLAVAATAPIRGCLLVGELEAEPIDVATAAGVRPKVAESCMTKLKAVGVLYRDDDLGCWRVHDWDEVNPAPKTDATAAERQRRYRERLRARGESRRIPSRVRDVVMERDDGRCVECGAEENLEYHHRTPVVDGGRSTADNLELRCRSCHRGHAGHASVTAALRRDTRDSHAVVTTTEVEGEVEERANALSSAVEPAEPEVARLCDLLAQLMRANDPKAKTAEHSKRWLTDMRLLVDRDRQVPADVERIIRWSQADSFWRANILSPGKLREKFGQLRLKADSERPALSVVADEDFTARINARPRA